MTCVVQFPSPDTVASPLPLLSFFPHLPLSHRSAPIATPNLHTPTPPPSPNRSPFSLHPHQRRVSCAKPSFNPYQPVRRRPFFFSFPSFLFFFLPFFPSSLSLPLLFFPFISPFFFLFSSRESLPLQARKTRPTPPIPPYRYEGGGENTWPSVFHESNVRNAVPAVPIDFDATDRATLRSISRR